MIILMPYRPSCGGMSSADGELFQKEDLTWVNKDGISYGRKQQDDIIRGINAINKNSRSKHKIIVCIDSDMNHDKKWLKEYDNVSIFKSTFSDFPQDPYQRVFKRYTETMKEIIMQCPDDEFVCYGYICDIICCKDWDHYIDEARKKFGDDYVFSPCWVEPRSPSNRSYEINGRNIWDKVSGWRKDVCHCLIYPLLPTRDLMAENKNVLCAEDDPTISEKSFEEWCKIAREQRPFPSVYVEPCGLRDLGYFTAICSINKRLKEKIVQVKTESGWDLHFESILGNKAIVTDAFLLHSHYKVSLDA